ncbi:MAG: 1,4-dihydroxy-2-naphthoate octaprenyltransferase, partial [Spartobacteria bacterium]|nr:1,4-dihydroxy-2-naphthoate octaprenyltransferase [Spartobacteria bacterium]
MTQNNRQREQPPSRTPGLLRGSTQKMKNWMAAVRPKTLWAAGAPVIMGTALAYADGGFHALTALAALTGALLIQIGANIWNDYGDALRGADDEHRDGPIRITQTGEIPTVTVRNMGLLAFALAAIPGLYLLGHAGWPVAVIGVSSIVAGLWYTGGRHPLAYMGMGEPFVLIFFGPVAVGGAYFVQALDINATVLLLGLIPGLLSVAILAVNNYRDMEGDRRVGKHTLAVRFGPRFA